MARLKDNNDDKFRRKPTKKKSWRRKVGFLVLLLLIVTILLYWQWSSLISMSTEIAMRVWDIFGWGLVFFDIALIALAVVIWRRKLSSFFYQKLLV